MRRPAKPNKRAVSLLRPAVSRWVVYILRCADGSLYTGVTNNLAQRLSRHQSGKGARYTRSRLPVELVFSRRMRDKSEALKREIQIKRLTRPEKLGLIRRPSKRARVHR